MARGKQGNTDAGNGKSKSRPGLVRRLLRVVKWLLTLFFSSSILAVVVYRYVPVYVTPLMVINTVRHIADGQSPVFHHKWVSLTSMSSHLPVAVIASEDQNFPQHHGFDMRAIELAIEYNRTHDTKRGASTISQQTAKNVFLWQGRTWIRKGLEAYFTFLIELFWSKERIMEVYLNSIEMGDNIYGAEAAAGLYFNKTVRLLGKEECARLAAVLPNPHRYHAAQPSPYITRRTNAIMRQMRFVEQAYPQLRAYTQR